MINKFSSMLIIFIIGLLIGSVVTWRIQSIRIDNILIKNKIFIDDIKVQAENAKKNYDEKINDGINKKVIADKSYKSTINNLNSDIKRLHNARASSSFLPTTSASSNSSSNACFDKAKFERTLQQLDDEIQAIITEGDEARLELDNAREWAARIHQFIDLN